MNQIPFPGRAAGWDSGPVQLIVWELELGNSVHLIPWSDETNGFALQIGKATGCAVEVLL